MLWQSSILESQRLPARRTEDEWMLLQDHVAEHSPQRAQSRDTAIATVPHQRHSHASGGCHHALWITSSCLHTSTQRGTGTQKQSGTSQKNVATRADTVCVVACASFSFCRKMMEPQGLTNLFSVFDGSVSFGVTSRGFGSSLDAHVDKAQVLDKLLHRALVRTKNAAHTLHISPQSGLRVSGDNRLCKADMVLVPRGALTSNVQLKSESLQALEVRGKCVAQREREKKGDSFLLHGLLFVFMSV